MWFPGTDEDAKTLPYGPHKKAIDEEMIKKLEYGRRRIQEMYLNAPRKCTMLESWIHIVPADERRKRSLWPYYDAKEDCHLHMTKTGIVPGNMLMTMEDIGECANHDFGWEATLKYDFYGSTERPITYLVITNLDYFLQWIRREAARACMALCVAMKRRGLLARDNWVPRRMMWRWILDHARAWETTYLQLRGEDKRLKTE